MKRRLVSLVAEWITDRGEGNRSNGRTELNWNEQGKREKENDDELEMKTDNLWFCNG